MEPVQLGPEGLEVEVAFARQVVPQREQEGAVVGDPGSHALQQIVREHSLSRRDVEYPVQSNQCWCGVLIRPSKPSAEQLDLFELQVVN